MTYECPFFEYNPNTGEVFVSVRENDKVSGETVARVNLDGIDDLIAYLQHLKKAG